MVYLPLNKYARKKEDEGLLTFGIICSIDEKVENSGLML